MTSYLTGKLPSNYNGDSIVNDNLIWQLAVNGLPRRLVFFLLALFVSAKAKLAFYGADMPFWHLIEALSVSTVLLLRFASDSLCAGRIAHVRGQCQGRIRPQNALLVPFRMRSIDLMQISN